MDQKPEWQMVGKKGRKQPRCNQPSNNKTSIRERIQDIQNEKAPDIALLHGLIEKIDRQMYNINILYYLY